VCETPKGAIFEVTPGGAMVWRYVNPVRAAGPVSQGDPAIANRVFRAYRYGPGFPGLVGRDLTPGGPIELFTRPLPVPDGTAATDPLTCSATSPTGDRIEVNWDTDSCPAFSYNLIFGNLADVSTYSLQGSECAIGTAGTFDWMDVPAGDLFFLVVGVEENGVYESSWGVDSSGSERHNTAPSGMCGVATKDITLSCP
jgi:hypothetical protein